MRDLGRLSNVAMIVARHGFGPLRMRIPLAGRLFDRTPDGDPALREISAPVRFAKLLAALGPTYIELGQILSMRKDLFPPEWIEAPETLQDDAPRQDPGRRRGGRKVQRPGIEATMHSVLDLLHLSAQVLEFQRNLDPARTVLTMQFFAGRSIRKLVPKSPEAQAAVNEIVHAAFKQALVDGVFHGDPHAGKPMRLTPLLRFFRR